MNANSKFLNEAKELERRWSQTGLLEGIKDKYERSCTAVLLENQRLMNEVATDTSDIAQFKRISIPLVRRIYPQLIANKQAWQDPWKRAKIEQIALLLKGALQAEMMVGLKMNVPKNKLELVIKLLPSITSPTIASLYNSDWYSIETIISETMVRELIPKLQKNGAEGVIEYPLNKVI